MTFWNSKWMNAHWSLLLVFVSFNAGWMLSFTFFDNFGVKLGFCEPCLCRDTPSSLRQEKVEKELIEKTEVFKVKFIELNSDRSVGGRESVVQKTSERIHVNLTVNSKKGSSVNGQEIRAPASPPTAALPTSVVPKELTSRPRYWVQASMKEYKSPIQAENTIHNIGDLVNRPLPPNPRHDAFECLVGRVPSNNLSFPICIYNPAIDVYVSGAIKKSHGILWEEANVLRILSRLGSPRNNLGFIDIGANIGVFSLPAAHRGHPVVSVEPMGSTLRRLKKSIELGFIEKKVQVVQAALSNETGTVYMMENLNNKGGSYIVSADHCISQPFYHCDLSNPVPVLLLDDLVDIIPFREAIMKVDCEGSEYKIFKKADKFLDTISVPYIMMEFFHYVKEPSLKSEVDQFVNYMKSKGYTPCNVDGVKLMSEWHTWPNDIAWVKLQ